MYVIHKLLNKFRTILNITYCRLVNLNNKRSLSTKDGPSANQNAYFVNENFITITKNNKFYILKLYRLFLERLCRSKIIIP